MFLSSSHQPDALAVHVIGGPALTVRQLTAQVEGRAAALSAIGICPGHAIGWWGTTALESIVTLLALARLGAVAVPFNRRLTAPELVTQAASVGCTLLLTDDAAALPGRTDGLRVQPLAELPPGVPIDLPPFDPTPDTVQGIIFTSGTTGQPKAAPIMFGQYHANAHGTAERLGWQPDDRWLLTLPLYHIGGLALLFRCVIHGTPVITPPLLTGHTTAQIADWLHDPALAITHISLVPTQLYRLLADGFTRPPHLRCILLGGAAASPDLLRRSLDGELPVAVTYGLTEAASQVATLPPERLGTKPGSVGQPLDGLSVRIVDEAEQDQPAGTIGEIIVRGATVFRGYLNPPDGRQPLRNGWLFTGDLGYRDADGDLWIVQRRTDLIISGGENVYPVEVEAALTAHPAIAAACVVGLPDPEWGQRVAAVIVPQPGADIQPAALTAFLRDRLAGYKLPRQYVAVPELPTTANGKPDRRAARALF